MKYAEVINATNRAEIDFTCSTYSSLASHSYFFLMVHMRRGKGRKNTSGNMCKVFVPCAGMLAVPIKFEYWNMVM